MRSLPISDTALHQSIEAVHSAIEVGQNAVLDHPGLRLDGLGDRQQAGMRVIDHCRGIALSPATTADAAAASSNVSLVDGGVSFATREPRPNLIS
jgi:hypothetical protein